MEYQRFIIQNYRAIDGPLEINFGKNSLIPIIGVNECGKTTILSAIFAFDFTNDTLNSGRHLKDTRNLYGTSPGIPRISSEITLETSNFVTALNFIESELKPKAKLADGSDQEAEQDSKTSEAAAKLWGEIKPIIEKYYRKRRQFPKRLIIERDLSTKQYGFNVPGFDDARLNALIGKQLVRRLPYILFFDDFRDSVDETIEIVGDESKASGWLSILNQLFKQTDENFSVFNVPEMESRQRKSVLAKVKRHLNETLTKEWQNFRLDESDALEILIEFEQLPPAKDGTRKSFLKLEIIETDLKGDEHYFFIRDRSKGFFWFFNFVMKLEFNPKVLSDQSPTVYLLDEPGSYLHASAQAKLCRKLRQLSTNNRVVYCTHSHYLLDPEVIPFSSIKVAEKSGMGAIQLVSIHEHKGNITERRSAFQPVIDALQIKPIMIDLSQQRTLIVEGIYDYYALELFRQGRSLGILPSIGADSIPFYISLLIAWRVPYAALWDNDESGRKAKAKAETLFGEAEAKNKFFLLPRKNGNTGNRILQNLFEGDDLVMVRESLNLPKETSFEKTIAALYFAPEKVQILTKFSERSRNNFAELFAAIGF